MRVIGPAIGTIVLLLMGACGQNDPLRPNRADTGVAAVDGSVASAAPPANGGPVVNEPPGKEALPDANSDRGAAAVDARPLSCNELSGGHPELLQSFAWQIQTRDCPSSACIDFLWIEGGCTLRLQRNNLERRVMMSEADCSAVKAWVTSTRFVDVIATGAGCVPRAFPEEMFEVILDDSRRLARKTFGCPEPAVAGVRACLGSVTARLFP